jgi:starch synthase
MHILFVTPEIAPFSQETPLARLSAVLPKALQSTRALSSISVVSPLYGFLDPEALHMARRLRTLKVARGKRKEQVEIYESITPERVRVFFLKHPLFDTKGVYGDPGQGAYENNAERFGFFCRAVVEFCEVFALTVDLLHGLGWPTGLLPVYLDAFGSERLADTLTVFSLGDPASQGVFPEKDFGVLELPQALMSPKALSCQGKVNFMQGGIHFGDFLLTSSPSHAAELLTKDGAGGLYEALQGRRDDLEGLLSGVEYESWGPEKDPHLPLKYDAEHLNGKRRNKAELQHIFGLPPRPMIPLFGYLSPLTEEKGAGIMIEALERLLDGGASLQCLFLSQGEARYVEALERLRDRHPRAVGLHIGQDEALLHRTVAGLDVLVVPSRTEPEANLHLLAMRYGTLPLVRAVGALKDTVVDASKFAPDLPVDLGVGVRFDAFTAKALHEALERALELLRKPKALRPLVEHDMATDFSWANAAKRYVELYEDLLFVDESDDEDNDDEDEDEA